MKQPQVVTLADLNRATLVRQMLLAREKMTAVRAIERLAGLQAQQARPPFVGLWSRVEGFRRADLLKAVRARKVVRATLMRATLHLASSKDFLALRGALQPGLTQIMGSLLRDRAMELDLPALLAEARAFFDAEPRGMDALRDHLQALHPRGDPRAMAYAVRTHLPLVQVPDGEAAWGWPAAAGFAVAQTWLGRAPAPDGGPRELVRRYLAAFGPAAPTDAQTWSGLSGLKATFEELRPRLAAFRDERGRELFDLPRAPRPPGDAPAPARFLPEFDNLVLAHHDRRRLLADEHRPRVVTKNLQVLATFLVDGVVAGTWKVERQKDAAALALQPFGDLTRRDREALSEEGQRLLGFVEQDARTFEVRFGKP